MGNPILFCALCNLIVHITQDYSPLRKTKQNAKRLTVSWK